ncbi:MAG: hypothetical protein ACR2N4_03825 [Jatrophihabitans sp.]
MGRNEAPLVRDGSAAAECAFWLRELRRSAALTYPEMATSTNYAASSLQGACSGRRLPSKKITLAMVAACDGDVIAWSAYWQQLRRLVADGEPSPADLLPPWSQPAAEPDWTDPPTPVVERSAADGPLAAEWPEADHTMPAATVGAKAATGPRPVTAAAGPSTTRRRLLWAGSVAASLAVGILIGFQLVGSRTVTLTSTGTGTAQVDAPIPGLAWEREAEQAGAPSVADPRDQQGRGPAVPFDEPVQVSCQLQLADTGSSSIGDAWYRIATAPWTDRYYVPAADFASVAAMGPAHSSAGVAIPRC